MEEKKEETREELREFEENPYNPEKKCPEDIVRIFYLNNLPIIPVVSKRGILLGILKKEEVIAELSDIERAKNLKIDKFITNLSRKMTLDEVLPYVVPNKEFKIINIFGEIQGSWTRLELLSACEIPEKKQSLEQDIQQQKEKQVMEWMIYLILEHIPRAIYAVNQKGKTIFYNSYFENLFKAKMDKEVETDFIEKSIKNSEKNEYFFRNKDGKEIYFYNKDMKFYYEKVPLVSDNKNVGFLIYCDKDINEEPGVLLPGINVQGLSFEKIMEAVERAVLVNSINSYNGNLGDVEKNLGLSRQALNTRIKKFGIVLPKKLPK